MAAAHHKPANSVPPLRTILECSELAESAVSYRGTTGHVHARALALRSAEAFCKALRSELNQKHPLYPLPIVPRSIQEPWHER